LKLFNFAFENLSDAGQTLQGIEILKQFLFFLDRDLQVEAMVSESLAASSTRVAAIIVS